MCDKQAVRAALKEITLTCPFCGYEVPMPAGRIVVECKNCKRPVFRPLGK